METHIKKELITTFGGDESSRMYMIVAIDSGKAEIVIEKTISKRMPVQKYEEAKKLYEKLNGGGGRRYYTLDELASGKLKSNNQ